MIFKNIIVAFMATFVSLYGWACDSKKTVFPRKGDSEYDSKLDLNKDGVQNILYQSSFKSFQVFVDKNLDCIVDEVNFYNSEENIVYGSSDLDFDYHLETRLIYKNSVLIMVVTDSNKNSTYDIVSYYKNEVLFKTEKFEPGKIATYYFKFGIPIDHKIEKTNYTEIEFEKSRVKDYLEIEKEL